MGYEERQIPAKPQRITLEGRTQLAVGGVEEVLSFDERRIVARTALGELAVGGEGLHVDKLSLDTGELIVSGRVDELSWSERESAAGFWSRLFG